MPAGHYDIHAEQGTTFQLYMLYRDAEKTPINLGNSTAELQVRRSRSSEQLLLHVTTDGVTGGGISGEWVGATGGVAGVGGITLNEDLEETETTGGISIRVDAETMQNIPDGRHFYDLEIRQGTVVDRLLEGRFIVDNGVIR